MLTWSCADRSRKVVRAAKPDGTYNRLEKGKDAALDHCGTGLESLALAKNCEKLQLHIFAGYRLLHQLVLLRVTKIMQHDTRLTGTLHGDFATA